MANKHIGIHQGGTVWHYSNGQDQVIPQSVGEFLAYFQGRRVYGPDARLYYGYRVDIC
jgi:hypothetical protein